jgi:hypothetical protein
MRQADDCMQEVRGAQVPRPEEAGIHAAADEVGAAEG